MRDGLSSRSLRILFVGVSLLAYGLMLIPILLVLVYSFLVEALPGGSLGVGLVWYERLLANEALQEALVNSLEVAAATSVIATVLGTLGAIAIERGRFPGRRMLGALTMIPLVMPELVMGIALLLWFATLRLTLGLHSIVLAHVTFAVSYVVIAVRASLRDFDPALLDAARDLGADPLRVYTRVVLPLISPGIAAGLLMAFCISFDDFLISFFTSGVGVGTLPVKLYSLIRFGVSQEMYALSSLLILLSVGVVLVQVALLRRRDRRR